MELKLIRSCSVSEEISFYSPPPFLTLSLPPHTHGRARALLPLKTSTLTCLLLVSFSPRCQPLIHKLRRASSPTRRVTVAVRPTWSLTMRCSGCIRTRGSSTPTALQGTQGRVTDFPPSPLLEPLSLRFPVLGWMASDSSLAPVALPAASYLAVRSPRMQTLE